MADLKDLRDKAANTLAEARSKLDEVTDETSVEDRQNIEMQVDRALDELADIEKRIERQERLEAAERRAEERAEAVDRSRRPGGASEAPGVDTGPEVSYRQAFHAHLRYLAGLHEMSPEERAVFRRGEVKPEQRAQTTSNAAGGYSIPETMLREVIISMAAWGPMYEGGPFRDIVTTGGNPMPFPTVNDTAVTAGAHTEGATMTDDGGKDVTFGTKQLDAYAYDTEWLRISKELLDDSFEAMEGLIGGLLGERLARLANSQLTTGTGSSAPNGIVTASSLGVTAAGAAAITFDEIIDLEHSVDPAYRVGPAVGYMLNDATLKAVRQLKDGDGNYLWQMGNVQAGVPASLNGRPYWINQDMPSLATGQKVMLFGDMSKYFVRKVGQPIVGALQDKDFYPGIGMAGYIRFDGELSDTAAVKHLITA